MSLWKGVPRRVPLYLSDLEWISIFDRQDLYKERWICTQGELQNANFGLLLYEDHDMWGPVFFSVLPTRIVHEVPVLLQSTVHSLYVLLITTLRLTIISITKCNKINSFAEISSVSGRSKSNIKMIKLRSYSANLIVRSLVCLYLNGYYRNNLNR